MPKQSHEFSVGQQVECWLFIEDPDSHEPVKVPATIVAISEDICGLVFDVKTELEEIIPLTYEDLVDANFPEEVS